VRLSVFAGALTGLGLLASGCSGSAGTHIARLSTSTTQSSSPNGGSPYGTALAFARCMRSHGVPLWPEPGSNGSFDQSPLTPSQLGVGKSQITSAEQACRSLLPAHTVTTQQPHVLAQALRFSRCMRTHGLTDFPDPDGNGAITIPRAVENSSAYPAAFHFCVHKYGVPPPPSSAKG
jgi:hypothetical protein